MSVCAGAAARRGETKFHDPSRAIYLSTVSSHKQRGGGQHRMGGRGADGRGGGGFLLGGIGVNDAAGDRLANGSVPVHPAGGGGAASGMNDSADPQQQQQRRVWPRLDVSRSDDETPMMTEKLKPAAATTTTQAEQSALLNTADSETREPPPPPAAPADDCDDLQLVSAGEVGVAGSRDAGEVVGMASTGENDTEAAAAAAAAVVDVIERPRDIAVSTSHQQLQRSCAAQRGMAAAAGSDAGSRRGGGGTAGSEAGSQARSSSLSRRASPDHIPRLHECWSLEPVRRAHQHHQQPHGATRSNLSSLDSLPANLTQPPLTTSSSEQQQQQPVRTAVS